MKGPPEKGILKPKPQTSLQKRMGAPKEYVISKGYNKWLGLPDELKAELVQGIKDGVFEPLTFNLHGTVSPERPVMKAKGTRGKGPVRS